jgi:hypothetical protein
LLLIEVSGYHHGNMTKKILAAGAMLFVFCGVVYKVDAAFYVRPEVQFSSLATSSHADSDIAVGGGLAWGGVFGRDQRFDVGVAITRTRYKGDFDFPNNSAPRAAGWTKVHSTSEVTPIQATFRYSFSTKNEKLRPYIGVAFGYSWVDIPNPAPSPGYSGGDTESSGSCWTGSLGGGVSYRLGRLTSVEFGYRYVFSDSMTPAGFWSPNFSYNFRYNAHVFTLALTQRFGRGGK